MKKVLFLITKSNFGGAQRYVFDLATSLSPDNFKVSVALGGTGTRGAPAGMLEERLQARGIRTILIRSFMRDVSIMEDVRGFFEVLRVINKEQPDIIHANSSKAGGIGMLAGFVARVPVRVFTVHGFAFNENRNLVATMLIRLASWLTLLFSTRALCVSATDARTGRSMPLVGHRVVHTPLAIVPPLFFSREEARASLAPSIPPQKYLIGSIGELHKNKGYAYALEACALLRDKGVDFLYLIFGSGEKEAQLKKMAADLRLEERVRFVGYVPNAAAYLVAFDVFLLPSLKEGFPYVLLEAGHAGCAVVASDIPSLRDILAHGKTALLARPKDPASIAHEVEKMLMTLPLRTSLAEPFQSHVQETYSLAAMVQKTAAAYEP